MPRVIHFEIHASKPEVLAKFYSEVFGWSIEKVPGMEYWLIETGPAEEAGINGAIVERSGPPPQKGQGMTAFVNTIDVPSLDESVSRVTDAGAAIAMPKTQIPGVGWVAYFIDPDGNLVGMLQLEED